MESRIEFDGQTFQWSFKIHGHQISGSADGYYEAEAQMIKAHRGHWKKPQDPTDKI